MSGRELFDRPSYNINIVRIGSISLDKRIRSCLAMPVRQSVPDQGCIKVPACSDIAYLIRQLADTNHDHHGDRVGTEA